MAMSEKVDGNFQYICNLPHNSEPEVRKSFAVGAGCYDGTCTQNTVAGFKKTKAHMAQKIEECEAGEQSLQQKRNFADKIIEAIPSIFYVIDRNATLIKWNKNLELISGYSPEELQGMHVLKYFDKNDVEVIRHEMKNVFSKGKSDGYVRLPKKNGGKSRYCFTGVLARIDGRDYQIGVGIDCEELETAREALSEIDERLALAVESSEAGPWALDYETKSLWMTPQCFHLYGIAFQDNLDLETFLSVIDPSDRKAFQDAMLNTIQTGEDLKTEYRVLLPQGGYRWLDVRGRMHVNSSGKPDRLMGFSMDITDRKSMEEQLRNRMKEIIRLKKELEKENVSLREEVKQRFEQEKIICDGEVYKSLMIKVAQVAPTNTTCLILGETGTGKEVLARAIHNMSKRSEKPLLTVNCASLPPSLIEGELFGREKGAYTGALTKMAGRFEMAHGATIFFDEIGELPVELQGKLLRAIELGQFERLGSTKSIQVDVRIIAATNRDLAREVMEGRFRRDLYYRLNVFPIVIPPLRERREDIPALVWCFVEQFEKKLGKRIDTIPPKTMEAIQAYAWPGNVRELKNVIEYAMLISDRTLEIHLPASITEELEGEGLEEIEIRHIRRVLEKTGWRIGGKNGAANILKLKRTSLYSKMKALGITPDAKK